MKSLSRQQKLWVTCAIIAGLPALFFLLGISGMGGGSLEEFLLEGGWGESFYAWYTIPGMFIALPIAMGTQFLGASDSVGTACLFFFAPIVSAGFFTGVLYIFIRGLERMQK